MNQNSHSPGDRRDTYQLPGLPGKQHLNEENLALEIKRIRKEFERICAELGILQKQLTCLLVLRKMGNRGALEDIKRNLGNMPTAALVCLLSNMEKDGYIAILGGKQITGAKLTEKALNVCRGKI